MPFPAGSATDTVARLVGQKLSDRFDQNVVIENRVGASGNLGSDAIARAAPDGYTIGLATTSTHAFAVSLSPNLSYDPLKDFAPVAMIATAPYVLGVYPGVPANNIAELVALAKARPRALNYASAGPASIAHLAGVLFSTLTGAELTHVPYRSSAQAVSDLTEGRIEIQFGTLAPTLPHIREGRMRALAVTWASACPPCRTCRRSRRPASRLRGIVVDGRGGAGGHAARYRRAVERRAGYGSQRARDAQALSRRRHGSATRTPEAVAPASAPISKVARGDCASRNSRRMMLARGARSCGRQPSTRTGLPSSQARMSSTMPVK